MPQTQLEKISSFPRRIDTSYDSNRYAAWTAFASLILGTLSSLVLLTQDISDPSNIMYGITVGVSSILIWALGREIDPDDAWVANVAQIVWSLILILFPFGGLTVGYLFAAVLGARILSKSTGLELKTIDYIVYVLVALSVAQSGGLILALMMTLPLLIAGSGGRGELATVIAIIGGVLFFSRGEGFTIFQPDISILYLGLMIVPAVGGLISAAMNQLPLRSKQDRGDQDTLTPLDVFKTRTFIHLMTLIVVASYSIDLGWRLALPLVILSLVSIPFRYFNRDLTNF